MHCIDKIFAALKFCKNQAFEIKRSSLCAVHENIFTMGIFNMKFLKVCVVKILGYMVKQ